jgi:hypothetical protein
VPEAGGPWDCLNNPSQTFQPGAMATVKVLAMDGQQPTLWAEEVDGGSALDAVQYTPMMGVSIRACPSAFDFQCTAGASPWQTVDSTGAATFPLPQSFGGFFQLTGPNLFTTSLSPGSFLSGDTAFSLPAPLITLSEIVAIESVLPGVTVDTDTDAGLGHVFLSVFDCNDHFAPGVVFVPGSAAPPNSSYRTTIFYTQGQGQMEFPSTTASATDNAGVGGIFNVPTGGFGVRATLAPSGQQIATANVFVNPGVATLVYIRVRTH